MDLLTPQVVWLTLFLVSGLTLVALSLWRVRTISLALQRAQRAATAAELTAGFAHEMKNSLTVVLGFAELARTAAEKQPGAPSSDDKLLRHLRELEKETRRACDQLQSFLSYAAGTQAPRAAHDLNEILRDALSMVRPMARMKDLLLDDPFGDSETPPAPLMITCDPFAVRQLLLNLLLNALTFAKTRITVRAAKSLLPAVGAQPAPAVEISVENDGPAVPDSDRARIFQGFTTREGGSGLGLSIAKQIAEAHGGSLVLAPSSSGAKFVGKLPSAV